MPAINITVEVSDEFIRDILTNAVESGGLGYWAEIRRVMRDKGHNVLSFEIADREDLMELPMLLLSANTPEGRKAVDACFTAVNADIIVDGIQRCLTTKNIADDIRTMIHEAVVSDDADIDATGCDCIVQMGLFEDIVFS